MILVVVAWLVSGIASYFALRRVRQVGTLAAEARISEGLERASRERLLAKLPERSALGRLAREVLATGDRRAAVAVLNEALGDVARELDVHADVPRSAGRVSLAAGGLTALIELARGLPEQGTSAMAPAGAAFAGGLVGVFACAMLGRSAEQSARSCREGWDRVARALERLIPDLDVGKSAPLARVDPDGTSD